MATFNFIQDIELKNETDVKHIEKVLFPTDQQKEERQGSIEQIRSKFRNLKVHVK